MLRLQNLCKLKEKRAFLPVLLGNIVLYGPAFVNSEGGLLIL
jgi:hypothetical protein